MMTEIDLWSTRLHEFYFSHEQIDESRKELDNFKKTKSDSLNLALYYTSYANPEVLDVGPVTNNIIKSIEVQVTKLYKERWNVITSWVNYVTKNNVHAMHRHGDNNTLCGILYYDDIGQTHFFDPRIQIYNDKPEVIKAEKGKCILFPGWLMHEMPPHNEEIERVTLPFNMNRVEL